MRQREVRQLAQKLPVAGSILIAQHRCLKFVDGIRQLPVIAIQQSDAYTCFSVFGR
jgi:hypothetical protein